MHPSAGFEQAGAKRGSSVKALHRGTQLRHGGVRACMHALIDRRVPDTGPYLIILRPTKYWHATAVLTKHTE